MSRTKQPDGKRPLPRRKPTPPSEAQVSSPANRARNANPPDREPAKPATVTDAAEAKGLNAARHAKNQKHAFQADLLAEGIFPSLMAAALRLDSHIETAAYRVYLTRVFQDLGDPTDPIERMLVEQITLAHFRVAQLHAAAGQARGNESAKLLNGVAARLLGELRRTALGLKAYRSGAPVEKSQAKLRLYKAAQ